MNATTKKRTYEFFINDWYDFNYWLENKRKFDYNKEVIYKSTINGTRPSDPEWKLKSGMWKIKLFVYKNAKFKLRDYFKIINTYDREAYIEKTDLRNQTRERLEHSKGLKTVLSDNNIENRI
jgi:hypothetical protein